MARGHLTSVPHTDSIVCICAKSLSDLEYSSHPGDIEDWIVKPPSMPLHGAGGGMVGHAIDRCISDSWRALFRNENTLTAELTRHSGPDLAKGHKNQTNINQFSAQGRLHRLAAHCRMMARLFNS